MKIKPSTITKGLLLAAIGGFVVAVPGAVFAIAPVVKLLHDAQMYEPPPAAPPPESDPAKVRRSLYRLEKNKYITVKQVGKRKFKLELTKKGKKLLDQYNFLEYQIKPRHRWDGQWRIFVFDIPEKKRTLRNTLRDKLKKEGFFLFQRSVWIYPFECEEEMRYICEFLQVMPYTLTFTGKIHSDVLLRKHFLHKGIFTKADLEAN